MEANGDRDENGRFTKGHPGGPGRPVFSIVSQIKAKLQEVPGGYHATWLELFLDEYFRKTLETGDGVAMRDLIDRFDGKPKQHVAVSDERKEAWRELQHSVFTEPETADDMEALPGSSTEATNIRGRSTFGEDLA